MLTRWALTAEQERDVMNFDPWGERDSTYVELRGAFVISRRPHECAICFGPIAKGDRVWAKTEADDGKAKTFHFCAECCWCIAWRFDEDDEGYDFGFTRMENRWEIGRKRSDV